MVLPQQFLARVFADSAELVVHISDGPLNVSGGDDGMLVQRELLVGYFLQRLLARGQALLKRFVGPLALGNVGANGDILARFAIRTDERNDGRVYPVNRT